MKVHTYAHNAAFQRARRHVARLLEAGRVECNCTEGGEPVGDHLVGCAIRDALDARMDVEREQLYADSDDMYEDQA